MGVDNEETNGFVHEMWMEDGLVDRYWMGKGRQTSRGIYGVWVEGGLSDGWIERMLAKQFK